MALLAAILAVPYGRKRLIAPLLFLLLAGIAPVAQAADATPSSIADKRLLLDVAEAGSRLVAVGQFGHIILSDDRGQTWRQAANVPVQTTLTSVHFPEAQFGFAVGHDSVILRTSDQGETWELVYEDPEASDPKAMARSFTDEGIDSCVRQPEPDSCRMPLLTVHFRNRLHGLAMGAFSLVMETEDGGETWRRRPLSPASDEEVEDDLFRHINYLFRAGDGAYYAAAELGAVYRSTDDGKTFTLLETPYEGSFWGGIALEDGGILVAGMRGNIWRSDDKGSSWKQIPSGNQQSFHDAVRLPNGDIALAGLGGVVALSRDNGQTFTSFNRPDRIGTAALAAGQNDLLLFGERGVVRQSLTE